MEPEQKYYKEMKRCGEFHYSDIHRHEQGYHWYSNQSYFYITSS